MFNTPALDVPSPFFVICEGEMDTMTAAQAGLPAVGVPGVENWQPFFARCFKGYDDVFVLADGDLPKKRPSCRKCKDAGHPECQGHRAGLELANKIASHVPQARTVMMPEGYDVNSFVLENGPDALRARIGV
jgi:DNA primase